MNNSFFLVIFQDTGKTFKLTSCTTHKEFEIFARCSSERQEDQKWQRMQKRQERGRQRRKGKCRRQREHLNGEK